MPFILRSIPAAAAALLLVSCGGGGGSAPDSFTRPPVATPTGGVAVDGYLSGATVVCDTNGSGVSDTGETSVVTNSTGEFTFPNGCNSVMLVTGGTNIDTGLPFAGLLKAPAGATVASPLTTLIAAGMSEARVVAALGLPAGTSLLTTDPAKKNSDGTLAQPDLLKQTLVVQQLAQKVGELLAGLGGAGSGAAPTLYSEVMGSFASTLRTSGTLSSASAVNDTTVASLLKAAVAQLQTSARVDTAVKTELLKLNADTLAQVTAPALAAKAETLLAATPAELPMVTKTAQSSTEITTFAAANKAQLQAPPNTASAALAQTLTDQVSPVPTHYYAIAGDAISLVSGSSTSSYSMAAFQSEAGISVSWPLSATAVLKVPSVEIGSVAIPAGQKLTAAVAITETTPTGKGKLLGYIENIGVTKTSGGLQIAMPSVANGAGSKAYGMSSDGLTTAIIDFRNGVAGVQNTLSTAAGSTNSILIGDVVNYAINQVSNDFTGINSLRGKYKVTIVIDGLPLRRADGSALPTVTLDVPTTLTSTGGIGTVKSVTGTGLVGYITLTN